MAASDPEKFTRIHISLSILFGGLVGYFLYHSITNWGGSDGAAYIAAVPASVIAGMLIYQRVFNR